MCICEYIYTHVKTVYVTRRNNNMCFSQGCEIPMERSACCRVKAHGPCSIREAKLPGRWPTFWDCKHFLTCVGDRRVTKYPSTEWLYSGYKPALDAKAAPMSPVVFPGHTTQVSTPFIPDSTYYSGETKQVLSMWWLRCGEALASLEHIYQLAIKMGWSFCQSSPPSLLSTRLL